LSESGQELRFDDDQATSDVQNELDSTMFNLSCMGAPLLDFIQESVHRFMAASLSEPQRQSLSLFCALHKAKSIGHISDDEWLILTSSDDHLQEAWTSSLEAEHEVSLSSSASLSKIQRELVAALMRIKSTLLQPRIRSWLETNCQNTSSSSKTCASPQKRSNLLPSDSRLHGLHLVAARIHAPHLLSLCIQEFVQSPCLQVPLPMHSVHEDQLLLACASIQATVICTTLPHNFFKNSLVQLCPHCSSTAGARGCVHFLIFDCKLFEDVDNSNKLDASEHDSLGASSSEAVAMPGFPLGRLQAALVSTISDAVASGKGLIVLNATNILQHWQGYLRHSSFLSNNTNSNKLSHLVLICDTEISSSSIRAIDAWSRVIFWNFPSTIECTDAYSSGTQWLLRDLRQQVLDSKKFMVSILTEGCEANTFQERLLVRITACLVAFTLAIHTRSLIESGFLIGQQMFDAQLFFNHSMFVLVSMTKLSGLSDTKAAFIAHGIPWLRHHVVFGRGMQLVSARDITIVFSIFDSLINSAIVDAEFTLPFLDAGIFPSLDASADLTLLLLTVAQRKNHAFEAVPSISLLNMQDWTRHRYSWIQGLLLNCAIENHEENKVSAPPQLLSSTSEILQLLQHVQGALPSIESSTMDSHHKHDFGCRRHQIVTTAVSESRLFVVALKQMRALIRSVYESLSRRSKLSSEEEADLLFLRRNNAAERWHKLFGFSRMMRVSEFIAHVNRIAAFWSSWSANASGVIPVLQANCYRRFDRVLHFLALQQASITGCKLSDLKFVVLPNSNQFIGDANSIRVQDLIGRGFSWNGTVAMPIADLLTDSEESSLHMKRQHATTGFLKRRRSDLLVPLGEVTILALSPRELQVCLPFSAAKLYSMPVLRHGFELNEADKAPLIWFLFHKDAHDNSMCVFF
jgi:hypothetical protein